MDVRKFACVGILGLGLASLGCSSSNNTTGTGGSNGSGGSTGKGGSGGSSATGGAGGSGVDAAILGCPSSDPPPSAEIANFADGMLDDGGLQIMGGVYNYGDTPKPQYSLMPGSIEITDAVVVSAANHYQGFGLYFNAGSTGTDCTDASAYTGIQFDVSGSLMGDLCTVQFSINDSEHADSTVPDPTKSTDASFVPNDPKASGPAGAYAPQLQIASKITSTTTTIQVPFKGTNAPTGGMPAQAIDIKKIEGVQWQMTTPLMGDGAASECDLDMTIKNIKFYK
ncbi:MAG TPA: hypothetical protein VKZ18_01475 [Polyangia bacterium]|nr:hypothetical protein [Polyangia bacterium]